MAMALIAAAPTTVAFTADCLAFTTRVTEAGGAATSRVTTGGVMIAYARFFRSTPVTDTFVLVECDASATFGGANSRLSASIRSGWQSMSVYLSADVH